MVQFKTSRSWQNGTVSAANAYQVTIEIDQNGVQRREVKDADEVRFEWEGRALTPMRNWSDASQQFKVRAAVTDLRDGIVTLHKSDGVEISLPSEKLCDLDQNVLRKLQKIMLPRIPELSVFSMLSETAEPTWNDAENVANLTIDPAPSYASVPMSGASFPRANFFEQLVLVRPIGGSDGWMLAGTCDSLSRVPGRIIWASLVSHTVKRIHYIPPAEVLIAVDSQSRQLLSTNAEGERLTLWNADPSMEYITAKKSWISSIQNSTKLTTHWAEIVTATRIIHESGRGKFSVWDTQKEQEVYRISQESLFRVQPAVSPGKRYIALPEDERVRILAAETGETLANLPIQGERTTGVGFHPKGDRLAVLTNSELAVWRFGSTAPPERFRADSLGIKFACNVEWVDDDTLLIDREILFDLRHQIPVWNYKPAVFEVESDDRRLKTQMVYGGKLCYAVKLRNSSDGIFVVGAVDLPGPDVRERIETLDPDLIFIMHPGHRVAIEVDCGAFDSEVEQALKQQIQDNDWVYDSSSSTKLIAKMGRSASQTVEYRPQFGRGESVSVTVSPYFSNLKLICQREIALEFSVGTGLPPMIYVRKDETAQSKANEDQKPDPGLFARVDIPATVFDPSLKRGLGTSEISAQGLTPK